MRSKTSRENQSCSAAAEIQRPAASPADEVASQNQEPLTLSGSKHHLFPSHEVVTQIYSANRKNATFLVHDWNDSIEQYVLQINSRHFPRPRRHDPIKTAQRPTLESWPNREQFEGQEEEKVFSKLILQIFDIWTKRSSNPGSFGIKI